MRVFDELNLAGIVPVIKLDDADKAAPLCEALSAGGLPVAEITFRTDAAEKSIYNVKRALPDVVLGAGTVLSIEQVKRATGAGAEFIVSPGLNPTVVGYCVSNSIPILPGCATPSDIETALSFGLTTVKFFPAEPAGGLKYIKAISAPYSNMKFVPTGGVNERNAAEYLAFNKVCAVGGSWMVPADAVARGDFDTITQLTRAAVKAILGITLAHIGVNSGSPKRASADARALCDLMGLSARITDNAVFTSAEGEIFEFMYTTGRGAHGHIALGVNDVKRAMWHLKRRGYAFDEANCVYDASGEPRVCYLEGEFAGFAAHIMRK